MTSRTAGVVGLAMVLAIGSSAAGEADSASPLVGGESSRQSSARTGVAESSASPQTDALGRGLDRLIALFEGMKPKEAATVLEQLDPELGTRILLGMRPRQAAKVVANLAPKRAADLTTRMSRVRPPDTGADSTARISPAAPAAEASGARKP